MEISEGMIAEYASKWELPTTPVGMDAARSWIDKLQRESYHTTTVLIETTLKDLGRGILMVCSSAASTRQMKENFAMVSRGSMPVMPHWSFFDVYFFPGSLFIRLYCDKQ